MNSIQYSWLHGSGYIFFFNDYLCKARIRNIIFDEYVVEIVCLILKKDTQLYSFTKLLPK